MKNLKLSVLLHSKKNDLLAYIVCLLFILAGSLVSLHRYWQFEVFYYDFGIFDTVIWSVSRMQAPIIEHYEVGGKWIFADHFNPSIFLLSPLYLLTTRAEIIFIAQAVAVGISGLLLYKVGVDILKNRLLPFAVVVCYYLFLGVQNAVITDFHEVTVSTLFLASLFWAYRKKRTKLYFLLLLVTLGFKESIFLVGISIGLAMIILERKFSKIAVGTIFVSLLWGLVAIKFIIPYFSGGVYNYEEQLPSTLPLLFEAFTNSPIKQDTILYSFWSFGFLPLLSPAFFFFILQDFATRFIPPWTTRWGLGLHYSAHIAIIFVVASFYSLNTLIKRFRFGAKVQIVIVLLLILNAVFLYRFKLHGPFGLAYNPDFYSHTKDFTFLENLISKVPTTASVMTQNNLAAHFTHQKVFLLRPNYKDFSPDFVVIDIRDGQNPNNLFGAKNVLGMIAKLQKDKQYSLVYKGDKQFVFAKKTTH